MFWKNLTQRSLADAMLIDHEVLKELKGTSINRLLNLQFLLCQNSHCKTLVVSFY